MDPTKRLNSMTWQRFSSPRVPSQGNDEVLPILYLWLFYYRIVPNAQSQ